MNRPHGIAVLALVLMASSANAGQNFRKAHPRRAEVNRNIRREKREIKRDMKNGKITKEQGQADLQNLKNVKQAEVADVKANGGHITREQQKGLNQQLRNEQGQIRGQVKGDKAAEPAAPASGSGE